MGMLYSYSASDMANAVSTVQRITYDACDMHLDGYTQWGAKQDLLRLKWIVDEALEKCPHFSLEDEFIKDYEKEKLMRILKK